jgi:hypothetical protein
MHCTMQKFSMPPPCTSTLRTSLTKLSPDNIYPHCARTNKIPLRSVNIVYTTHAIITHMHTVRASIMHAPLNLHPTMLNLMRTFAYRYFLRITTLHRATPNLSAQNCSPIFSMHYHFAPLSAKFKCAHLHAHIFRALSLCTAQCQILAHTPARQ